MISQSQINTASRPRLFGKVEYFSEEAPRQDEGYRQKAKRLLGVPLGAAEGTYKDSFTISISNDRY